MRDNVGAEGRLKANHLRWHTKKGIVKPGCSLCMLEGGPAAVPEPVAQPLITTQPPPQFFPEPTSQQPAIDPLSAAKRERWRDDAWQLATVNLDARVAAQLLGCTHEFFLSEIQDLFNDDWSSVCELAMGQQMVDLCSAAVRAAKGGDFRGITLMLKENFLPSFSFAREKLRTKSELASLSDHDLRERLMRLLEDRGVVVQRMADQSCSVQGKQTVELRDPSPEELSLVVNGGVIVGDGSLGSSGGAGTGPATKSTSLVSQPPVIPQKEPAVREPVKESEKIPVRPSEALRLQPTGPVICNTDVNTGLKPGEVQYGGRL